MISIKSLRRQEVSFTSTCQTKYQNAKKEKFLTFLKLNNSFLIFSLSSPSLGGCFFKKLNIVTIPIVQRVASVL